MIDVLELLLQIRRERSVCSLFNEDLERWSKSFINIINMRNQRIRVDLVGLKGLEFGDIEIEILTLHHQFLYLECKVFEIFIKIEEKIWDEGPKWKFFGYFQMIYCQFIFFIYCKVDALQFGNFLKEFFAIWLH